MAFSVLIGSPRPAEHGPLEAALRRKGIRPSVFTDGAAMLRAAEAGRPDLVVADLHLAGLHGVDLARSLADRRTAIMVDDEEPAIEELRARGLELLVRPPGGAEGLAAAIEGRLAGPARIVEDAAALDDPGALRARLLELAGGDEDKLLRTVLEDPETHLLCGAYVRGWRIEEEWLRRGVAGASLGLLLVRIDGGFEELRRRHGEAAVREVEARVAGILLAELPGTDLPARLEPGQFLVLMPGADATEAGRRAFALRREVAELRFEGRGGPFGITVSMGLAAVPHAHVRSAGELLGRAEEALAGARHLGPGRVCVWQGVRELQEEELSA